MSGRPKPNVPLTLESPERVADGMGGYATSWRALGVIWGEMRASGGREVGGETAAISRTTWRIAVRAAREGDPRRPRPDQRLRMGTRLFRIEAVVEQGTDGRWLTCHAIEEDRA